MKAIILESLNNPNSKLRKLEMSGGVSNDIGMKYLSKAIINGYYKLEDLTISYNHIDNVGIEYLYLRMINRNCKLK